MNIHVFIETYKEELSPPIFTPGWGYESWAEWARNFNEQTAELQPAVKQSYFEVSNAFITAINFEALHGLLIIHEPAMFGTEDEQDLLQLVSNATNVLLSIENQQDMEWALNYLHCMLDMLCHEVLYSTTETDLRSTLKSLTLNIELTSGLDPKNTRCLVQQKIELMARNNKL